MPLANTKNEKTVGLSASSTGKSPITRCYATRFNPNTKTKLPQPSHNTVPLPHGLTRHIRVVQQSFVAGEISEADLADMASEVNTKY